MDIKQGATRTVFVIGSIAVKIPRIHSWKTFLNGLLANMQEVSFHKMDTSFCPVTFNIPGGFLLIMPKADPLPDHVWTSFDYNAFVNKPYHCLPVEEKQDSFGLLNGKIVAVDYGN